MKYTVTMIESIQKEVVVEAADEDDAREIVMDLHEADNVEFTKDADHEIYFEVLETI